MVITMETRADTINFEHNGVKYTMTEQEIEAACQYKKHHCRLEITQCHFICEGEDGSGLDSIGTGKATVEIKETGIIRRMDDLGRLPFPPALRREVGLPKDADGIPFELGTLALKNGKKVLTALPYEPESGGEA